LSKLKKLAGETVVYGASHMLARFLNYLLVPYYTNVFSEGEYGVVSILYSSMMFFNILMTFGMESAYLRYGKDGNGPSVFMTSFISITVQALIIAAFGLLLVPELHSAFTVSHPLGAKMWYYVVAIVFLDAVAVVPFSALRLNSRVYVYSALRLLNVVVTLGLNFYLISYQKRGIEAILEANIIASAAMVLLVLPFCASQFKGHFDLTVLKKSLIFGLPYVPAGIGYIINEFIDRFFLGRMDDASVAALYGAQFDALDITGIYSGCYKLSIFMTIGVQMFRMAWQPFFIRHKDDPDYKSLFIKAFVYFNVAAGALFVVVSLFKEELVAISIPGLNATVLNHRYWWALWVVPILLWANWFQGLYTHFTAGVFIKEETKKLPFITLSGAAITVFLLFTGLPYFGMAAAAVATLISYGVMSLLIWRISEKVMPVNYPLPQTLGLMSVLFTLSMLPYWLGFAENTLLKLALFAPSIGLVAWSVTLARVKNVPLQP
jgi:O-antigen/teichoic acid export membrane protein